MDKVTKRKLLVFFFGLLLVSFLTVVGTVAFFNEVAIAAFVRNIFIIDAVFVVLYVAWIKLHRGYETIYKSGLDLEDKK
ncbi:hypothetical protein HYV83_04785 [Candidatus Woesearchaeota archaeon]|nr:hypothetical protein [Candidatus Woesearchaeota archaeon]